MSFPRYPEYKDSGVEWLGEVPTHWDVISIKWLSPVKRGASPRPIDDQKYFDNDGEFAWVRITDVSACDGILKETTQRLSELGSSLSVKIAPGELFVSIAGTVGKPCLSAIKACIHDGFVYFPLLKLNPKFLYRVFEVGACYGGLGKWGTQLNLNTDTIGSIRVAVPPPDELIQVLKFIDTETAKIDALVDEQQRLIELLKEKRQAIISHAVTKGLNPDAPMKPSGVQWLGEVPAHWEAGPLKRYWTAIDCKHVTAEFVDDGIPLASIREVQGRWIALEEAKCTTEAFYELLIEGDRRPTPGDLIFSRNATVGEVGQVHADHPRFAMGQDVVLLRKLLPEFSSDYMQFVIRSPAVTQQLAMLMVGSTFKRINVEEIRSLVVPWPPGAEQSEIAAFLENEVERADSLIAEAQRAIDFLQERRTALISAAVTGQIDVRAIADRAAA